MRGIRSAAALAAAALFTVAPSAAARDVDYGGSLYVTGAITIGWHGDPGRGCAAAGLCGYAGFVGIRPGEGDYDLLVNGRGRLIDGFGSLDLFDSPPLVRVKRTESSGDEGGCVDDSPIEQVELRMSRAGGRRVRLRLATPGLSSGRCAGPRISDLASRLPRRTRSVSRLMPGGASIHFSGSFPYSAGRFSGTVRSTLRVSFGKPTPDVVTPPPSAPRRRHRRPLVRIVHVHASYAVTGFAGALTTQFEGLTDPTCADFDACGVAGSAGWQVAGQDGIMAFDGDALARRTDRGLRGGLAALRRRGSYVFGGSRLGGALGTSTVEASRQGGERCRDTARTASGSVGAFNSRGRLMFELGGEDAAPAEADLLRAGCPGPRDQDVIGFAPAARGSIPLRALGRRSIGVRLRGSGSFAAHGYTGSRSADFTLGLKRISIHAVYRRARGIW